MLFDVKPVLSYEQCSSGLYNVRFVLTDGYVGPQAAGGDHACQMEVLIALYQGVLCRQAGPEVSRRPWERLCVLPAGFSLAWVSIFYIFSSLFTCFLSSSHPFLFVSSFPLSFLPFYFFLSSVYVIQALFSPGLSNQR